MYDIENIRRQFPILQQKINGKPNVFLDTAASAQKPICVIERIKNIYENEYSNVHRGSYFLSEQLTYEYENARKYVQKFINADSACEIVFTRNATESINLVAATWGDKYISEGDEVLISQAEHHANLVPWQILCKKKNAKLKIFEIADDGAFVWENFAKMLSDKTKIVAVTAMSNVLGTIFPIKQICGEAHKFGAKVLVDACQFAVHNKIDVKDFDCDFLAFSGHKTYGPTGIGVLFGKLDILQDMPPYQFGGDMIDHVWYDNTTFDEPPARFEAGTPAIVQAVGLAEALKFMDGIGLENIMAHEDELCRYAKEKLSEIKVLKIVGTAEPRGGVFSFAMEGIHPQDLAFVLDKEGVSVRTGHHCAEPLVARMGYTSLARASFGLYTSKEDIDFFIKALHKAQQFLG